MVDDAAGDAQLLCRLHQRQRVFGKARAAIAETGIQELFADTPVQADAAGHIPPLPPHLSYRSAAGTLLAVTDPINKYYPGAYYYGPDLNNGQWPRLRARQLYESPRRL
jgi:hypothetical protein